MFSALQDRANQIQSDLEGLVKSLNEQCKQYGLRTKPTTLVELPFGIFDFIAVQFFIPFEFLLNLWSFFKLFRPV